MRFIKVNNKKLKIIIPQNELPNYGDLDKIMQNPEKARNALIDILKQAYFETGYDASDYKIEVNAVQTNDTVVFTVTKLVLLTEDDLDDDEDDEYEIIRTNNKTNEKKKAKPIKYSEYKGNSNFGNLIKETKKAITKSNKSDKPKERYLIYRFYTMDDFIDMCKTLKFNNFYSFKRFCKRSELYKYNEKYYLAVVNPNEKCASKGIFYTNITEFISSCTNEAAVYYILREKGEIIFKEKALDIGVRF